MKRLNFWRKKKFNLPPPDKRIYVSNIVRYCLKHHFKVKPIRIKNYDEIQKNLPHNKVEVEYNFHDLKVIIFNRKMSFDLTIKNQIRTIMITKNEDSIREEVSNFLSEATYSKKCN